MCDVCSGLRLRVLARFGSQADFAQYIGQSESSISRVLRGRRELSLAERKTWAGALGYPASELFKHIEIGGAH